MPRPARAAEPLQMLRRTDDVVVGHGIAAGIVQIVRPLVDVLRARLDRLLPGVSLPDVGHAVGNQDAHHLRHGDAVQVFGHDEVDQIVDVRQPVAGELIDADLAIRALAI